MTPSTPKPKARLHPLLVILAVMLCIAGLTHIIPAGKFERHGTQLVHGSYRTIPKIDGMAAILAPMPSDPDEAPARAVGVIGFFDAIPAGMAKAAPPIFMVIFIGGMFGVLNASGAIDAGLDRLLQLTAGNVHILTCGLMMVVSAGASFLGLLSEYMAIVPLLMALGDRLGLPKLYAPAVVIVAGNIGYAASVANPIVLSVAQPLAGVPIFSGLAARLAIWVAMLAVGVGYVLFSLRHHEQRGAAIESRRLSFRHVAILATVGIGTLALVIGTSRWGWGAAEHAALFLAFALALALVSGLRPSMSADAFIGGMQAMLLPASMVGFGRAMEIMLQSSQVLDSIVHGFATAIAGHAAGTVAAGIMLSEMLFDVVLQSTATKAAISLPVLTPIAHLSGVGGQVSVTALTLASGLTNMITPTNGLLLAFLATARVDYAAWFRFVGGLFAILVAVALIALQIMVFMGA